jgi:hypothetical protein
MAPVSRGVLGFHKIIIAVRRTARALTKTIATKISCTVGNSFASHLTSYLETLRRRRPPSPSCEAHARGIRLLIENLTPVQREQYKKFWYFDVAGGETGRRYRIRNGLQLNVEQLDSKGRPLRRLCFMPKGDLVVGDMMLAQKLALELFESEALKVANTSSPDHSEYFLP